MNNAAVWNHWAVSKLTLNSLNFLLAASVDAVLVTNKRILTAVLAWLKKQAFANWLKQLQIYIYLSVVKFLFILFRIKDNYFSRVWLILFFKYNGAFSNSAELCISEITNTLFSVNHSKDLVFEHLEILLTR